MDLIKIQNKKTFFQNLSFERRQIMPEGKLVEDFLKN